jgi:phosphorylcholine metabolism protein LicD
MAGKHTLEGKNGDIALIMLKKVTNILDKKNIPYSLKAGTLLGVIRENRLLPWDNDMDICITEKYYKQLLESIPELKTLGYMLWTKEFETNNSPFKKGITRIIKLRNRRLYFIRGDIGLDIFIKFKKENNYYWQAGLKKYSVPAKYHDELILHDFDNKKYLIPKDYEGYLSFKYGNWKTPVKIWNPFLDDKAIVGDI